ncbi:MAG: ComEC/Rec2 family competence protein [Victivallales bacterium]|nr:ComEC/Rec2 family competence protein [Victivallales bacterium]
MPIWGEELQELGGARGRVTASVAACGTSGMRGQLVLLDGERECREHLMKLLPGDVLEADVVWDDLPPSDDPQNGFYRDVLRSKGIDRLCRVNGFSSQVQRGDLRSRFMRSVHKLRRHLARRMISGVENPECAGMLLALGVGMGEYMPRERMERMVASGTVHVFAISGMHVGMTALLVTMTMCLALVPIHVRWGASLAAVCAYVVLTGASVSALRSLLMVAVARYSSYRFRMTSWLNALGISGLISLLIQPRHILSLGFVYSYAVVAALLLSAPLLQEYGELMTERMRWLPGRAKRQWHRYIFSRAVLALLASCVAWLSGLGVSLARGTPICLVSPIVNVPLSFVTFVTLAGCQLKLLLSCLAGGLDWLWGGMLSAMMEVMLALAECGSFSGTLIYCGEVPQWATAGYNVLFGLWLLSLWGRKNNP